MPETTDRIAALLLQYSTRVEDTAHATARMFAQIPERELIEVLRNGNGPSASEVQEEPTRYFLSLRDLLDDPEILKPPPPVLPRLVWRGRTTLLSGRDKLGKSSVAADGVAHLSRGSGWLGEKVGVGSAIVAAPDEALPDTVRRLSERNAHPDMVRVLTLRPDNILAAIEDALREEPADLVVIDSLAEVARLILGRSPEDGDSSGWGAVVRPFVQLSRDHDCGILLLHHPRRSDDQYRGSLEIAAAVDCLWEMVPPNAGEDPTLRRFRGRARWQVEDFSIRMDSEERFLLGSGGEIPLEARVLMDVRTYPGTSRADQFRRLGGRKATHVAAVNRMLETGAVVERGAGLFEQRDVEEVLL